jgi:hypothetical protein
MPERKSHGNRGSLMDLAKPRLAQTPLMTPMDEAERLLLPRDAAPSTVAPPSSAPIGSLKEAPSVVPRRGSERDRPAVVSQAPGPDSATFGDGSAEPLEGPPGSGDLVAKLRKTRQPIAVVGFKLPATLKEELLIVAQHNGTDMTRIVIEALERFLPELPHPANWKG